MGTARHSPPGEERVTCGMCKKEIPKSEATSSEATDYVSYFCGKHCYDLWRRPHEKFDDQIKPPSTGPNRRCCGKRRARQIVPAAPPLASLPPRGRRQFAIGFERGIACEPTPHRHEMRLLFFECAFETFGEFVLTERAREADQHLPPLVVGKLGDHHRLEALGEIAARVRDDLDDTLGGDAHHIGRGRDGRGIATHLSIASHASRKCAISSS